MIDSQRYGGESEGGVVCGNEWTVRAVFSSVQHQFSICFVTRMLASFPVPNLDMIESVLESHETARESFEVSRSSLAPDAVLQLQISSIGIPNRFCRWMQVFLLLSEVAAAAPHSLYKTSLRERERERARTYDVGR